MDAAERKARIDQLAPWFVTMSRALHLAHWELRTPYEETPSDEQMTASIERTYGRNAARIYLSDHFLGVDLEEQRETYTHELLHCHFRAIIEARDGLEDLLGKPANLIFVDRMKMAEEWAVDAIAGALAPHLPLPPVFKPKRKPKKG